MTRFHVGTWAIPDPLANIILASIAVLVGLLVHALLFGILGRFTGRTISDVDDLLLERTRRPARWILAVVALAFVRPALALSERGDALWAQAAGLLIPALVGWLGVAVLRTCAQAVEIRADISVSDNLAARRRRTRSAILTRIGIFAIGFVTICLMLLSIPGVRNVGVTLMASAGLAGLAVGAAAQPALKNLIAGIQMAFTEPIRIDDVVIVDGEWGRVEDIRLTYVVIKLWDERRLVVPVARFLEQSFQNWTRETSQLLGTVLWRLDPATDVARLRGALEGIVRTSERWDGRFFNMQVTDMSADSIEVRALVTAKDASTAFDLRCEVREAVLAFVRAEMPEALPRTRARIENDQPAAG